MMHGGGGGLVEINIYFQANLNLPFQRRHDNVMKIKRFISFLSRGRPIVSCSYRGFFTLGRPTWGRPTRGRPTWGCPTWGRTT